MKKLRGFSPRPMQDEDLDVVITIEKTACAFPWTYRTFVDCLYAGYESWVYERDKKIYGYGIASVQVGEAHILNICVHPDYQHQGCGHYILAHLLKISKTLGAQIVFLEVRPSNHRALSLYYKFGFNEVGIRKGYYPGRKGREDAFLLGLSL
ncbi:ribosomal protein S18-alanine N-acetyltransferase [Candidatus Nitrosacidococcus tergens]|uniref:[Ribosomal protein bS18]-alanine N-acetyltransferase n=1 Tax=Candidatus Nitrosacidococcus tergens TaxID=553981 RepID=A0A7G1QAF4_9GAMM|nr:ribosomal protein S18-alanine N-acetyltransferase [Candidatus Nitrosacidococcus tergens]CAB1276659.1 Ribosomal-protein-alanine acetyltransferase [Candidatus Nitrosacidococcus tergens]